jgi:hypothetical protein
MKSLWALFLAICPLFAVAEGNNCAVDTSQQSVITKLFSGKSHVYSLLWWQDPKGNVINARSFIINGRDSVPIFSSEAEGKTQVAGSGHERELVGVAPALLAAILQKMEYSILNPGGPNPIQFKTCIVKPYAKAGGA